MKRRITLSIALALSIVLASLTSSDSTVTAQQIRPITDSGVVSLGENQVLRVFVAAGDVAGDDNIRVRFRQIRYEPCQASPKLCVQSQTTTPTINLAPNEAASVDGAEFANWRTEVLSNNRNVTVTNIVFDTSTQRVVSIFHKALTTNE